MSKLVKQWCTHKTANFEGIKGVKYNPNTGLESALEALDVRVRTLERISCSTTLPPMLKPTWDSLEYRLRYLDDKIRSATLEVPTAKTNIPRDLEVVKSMASSIFARIVAAAPAIESSKVTDDKDRDSGELDEIAQRLCYIAGHFHRKVRDFEENTSQLYEFVITLSLYADSTGLQTPNFGPVGPGRHPQRMLVGGHPPPPPPPPPPQLPFSSKGCCGCCACFCHNAKNTSKSGLTKRSLDRLDKRRWRVPGFGWLKKLRCFRSKERAGSVYTASTRSTIV
ncbi:uncharacterized protein BCR38DRAFT_410819 [Pseudomassariella vexata]|uniref:Uncharacterized protein n=1 Tax=Pseudomassariella vexata TaxID=1141098 RepID=A0A1Y2DTA9_9PEZI|nr:uncharacterized protein BCR38DRAFT_410819 [Pseudomassariella vexata]ORY62399.1 hypothetical protein BCR38DRAFT_410819 [Pseudomassariella vexata]